MFVKTLFLVVKIVFVRLRWNPTRGEEDVAAGVDRGRVHDDQHQRAADAGGDEPVAEHGGAGGGGLGLGLAPRDGVVPHAARFARAVALADV